MSKIQWLRKYCPNIPILRNVLKKQKLKQICTTCLSKEEMLQGEQDEVYKENLVRKKLQMNHYAVKKYKKVKKEVFNSFEILRNCSDEKRLETDMAFCFFAYGFMPDEYMCYHLETRTPEERKLFVSDRDCEVISYTENDIIDMGIFFDKYLTYKYFSKYYKREAVGVSSSKDFKLFEEFVMKHPCFVRKQTMLSRGNSVQKVNLSAEKLNVRQIFEDMLKNGPSIAEELIIQGKEFSALNSSSVNTIRIITFITDNGVEIPFCFLKVGRAGSFVDNGGAGGILVGIDKNKGVLNTDGVDELDRWYSNHPDSGIVFKGYVMPKWQEAINLAISLAKEVPSVRYVGWDLTWTDHGWIMIEGNCSGQFIGPQMVQKRGIKSELSSILKICL